MVKTPKRKKPGPQGTLVDPPHVAKIKAALAEQPQGFQTWSDVVDFINAEEAKLPASERPNERASLSYFLSLVRDGLSTKPSHDWVRRLKLVGIYDLVVRKEARRKGA